MSLEFDIVEVPQDEAELRIEVRTFISRHLPTDFVPGVSSTHSPEFSRMLGQRGWLGMCIPEEYGGHARAAVERFIVTEELLAAHAPVGAHFTADRQSSLAILKFGTEEQKSRLLPGIAAGTLWFSLGMSEPDSGSDLASVRTRAHRVEGGWVLNGRKSWTSGAHHAHFISTLCRTSPASDDRHSGLSQLMVDLKSPGVTVTPVHFIDGTHNFNEVTFDDVYVPDDMLLGEAGSGWAQVTSELAFERSGPERYLSTFALFVAWISSLGARPSEAEHETVGRLAAQFVAVRQMSLAIAKALDKGEVPDAEAAVVKALGTSFEQEVVEVVRARQFEELDPDGDRLAQTLARAVLTSPAHTIQGGTNEILRSVAAKGIRP